MRSDDLLPAAPVNRLAVGYDTIEIEKNRLVSLVSAKYYSSLPHQQSFTQARIVGQDFILRPIFNRPV
jgi:hypothetical protein